MNAKCEFERMWNEAVIAYFKLLSHYFSGRNDEETKTIPYCASGPRFKPATCRIRSIFFFFYHSV